MFNKALNNMRFIYFYCTNAIREFIGKIAIKIVLKSVYLYEQKSSFFIAGKHAVIGSFKK